MPTITIRLGGVHAQATFNVDRDIETGEEFFVDHGPVTVNGVDISNALYAMGESRDVERRIFRAIEDAIEAKKRAARVAA